MKIAALRQLPRPEIDDKRGMKAGAACSGSGQQGSAGWQTSRVLPSQWRAGTRPGSRGIAPQHAANAAKGIVAKDPLLKPARSAASNLAGLAERADRTTAKLATSCHRAAAG